LQMCWLRAASGSFTGSALRYKQHLIEKWFGSDGVASTG
jgi:hypothetical protein